jgi:membrane fusion protein (multidrug efflux system)
MKLSRVAICGILIASAASAGAAYGFIGFSDSTSTDNAYVRGDVTPISAKISGYVVEVGVHDNQQVRAHDLLFRIDDVDFEAKVAQARAALESRKTAVGNLDSRLALQRATIKQAQALVAGANAEAERSSRDLTRTQELNRGGWASQARSEQVLSSSQQASAKVAEAQANLTAANRQIEVIESQRPQLLADIQAAEATLRLAQFDLEGTVVRAPVDGWVGERQARIGQYVRPGSLLIALVSRDIWVVANFKETQLPLIGVGSEVSVTADGVPGAKFRGSVESLSPASGAQFALLPPDNATGNFTRIVQRIPVRIALAPEQSGRDRLRPGMSAVVGTTGRSFPFRPVEPSSMTPSSELPQNVRSAAE